MHRQDFQVDVAERRVDAIAQDAVEPLLLGVQVGRTKADDLCGARGTLGLVYPKHDVATLGVRHGGDVFAELAKFVGSAARQLLIVLEPLRLAHVGVDQGLKFSDRHALERLVEHGDFVTPAARRAAGLVCQIGTELLIDAYFA